MSSIKLTADSGGGTFEIKAPASSANTRVLTLPDATNGTVARTDDLNVVKLQSVESGSPVANITFDSLDTTTYKYFRLVINTLPATDNAYMNFYFRVSGTDQTGSSTYHWGNMGITTNTASLYDEANISNYGNVANNAGNAAGEGHRVVMDIVMKKSGEDTSLSNYVAIQAFRRDSGGNGRFETSGIHHTGDVNPDGFKIVPNSGNWEDYNYTLYGVKR